MIMDIINVLRRSDLTHGLTDSEIEDLAKIFHSKHAKKGDVIIREGDPSSELYIISKGRVGVLIYSSSQPGEKEKITTLRDNDIFGEFSMIDGTSRSATVVTDEDSDFIYVDYLDFHRYLEENEHVGFFIMRNIAKILTAKLRMMNFEVRNAIL
ncbi:MAG: hypothetical protein DRP89_04970 [Candidatus Neomarinimicrobiota bacterium]|nr:MAG: hypothetical protein DRP89_04970 [Candidatus Neomarinimicrobiota bacterium]